MKDKLNKFLGLAESLEKFPDENTQRLKYLQQNPNIPDEKDREIWQNILSETSSADSKPLSVGFGSVLELFRQRKLVFAGVSLIVFFCAALIVFLMSSTTTDITVASLDGTVLINGRLYTDEMHLKENDILETPEGNKAKMLLGKSNVVFLDSGTRIVLGLSGRIVRMNLARGRIGAVLNDKEAFSGFHIAAPLVLVEIRGTSFFLDASIEKKNYLCICNGSLDYHTRTDAHSKSFTSGHHRALEFTLEGSKVKVNSSTLKYHDDRYMDFIAALINEKISWVK